MFLGGLVEKNIPDLARESIEDIVETFSALTRIARMFNLPSAYDAAVRTMEGYGNYSDGFTPERFIDSVKGYIYVTAFLEKDYIPKTTDEALVMSDVHIFKQYLFEELDFS